jgi:hypothetical protein
MLNENVTPADDIIHVDIPLLLHTTW